MDKSMKLSNNTSSFLEIREDQGSTIPVTPPNDENESMPKQTTDEHNLYGETTDEMKYLADSSISEEQWFFESDKPYYSPYIEKINERLEKEVAECKLLYQSIDNQQFTVPVLPQIPKTETVSRFSRDHPLSQEAERYLREEGKPRHIDEYEIMRCKNLDWDAYFGDSPSTEKAPSSCHKLLVEEWDVPIGRDPKGKLIFFRNGEQQSKDPVSTPNEGIVPQRTVYKKELKDGVSCWTRSSEAVSVASPKKSASLDAFEKVIDRTMEAMSKSGSEKESENESAAEIDRRFARRSGEKSDSLRPFSTKKLVASRPRNQRALDVDAARKKEPTKANWLLWNQSSHRYSKFDSHPARPFVFDGDNPASQVSHSPHPLPRLDPYVKTQTLVVEPVHRFAFRLEMSDESSKKDEGWNRPSSYRECRRACSSPVTPRNDKTDDGQTVGQWKTNVEQTVVQGKTYEQTVVQEKTDEQTVVQEKTDEQTVVQEKTDEQTVGKQKADYDSDSSCDLESWEFI